MVGKRVVKQLDFDDLPGLAKKAHRILSACSGEGMHYATLAKKLSVSEQEARDACSKLRVFGYFDCIGAVPRGGRK